MNSLRVCRNQTLLTVLIKHGGFQGSERSPASSEVQTQNIYYHNFTIQEFLKTAAASSPVAAAADTRNLPSAAAAGLGVPTVRLLPEPDFVVLVQPGTRPSFRSRASGNAMVGRSETRAKRWSWCQESRSCLCVGLEAWMLSGAIRQRRLHKRRLRRRRPRPPRPPRPPWPCWWTTMLKRCFIT